MKTDTVQRVKAFYANKDIFITGGTGYLGKVLVEKLLRSCSELNRIFVLIRPKKGHSPAARLKLFTEDQVFDRVRDENPKLLHKIECVSGDVREPGLGISEKDFERIRKCAIVIHSAATVRFDELLTDSILMNTRGTRETLRLAACLDKVEIFNHVSTTFCNPDYPHSEEKLYPIHVHWKDAIKLAEEMDVETLQTVSQVYMNFHPNTYTFSKRLSEHLVNDMNRECNFPIVILRPSVVSPTIEEPFPGWVDNFNGPIGLSVASAVGISRFLNMSPDLSMDYQPVDVVAKSIILSTWEHATVEKDYEADVPIYNSSSCGKFSVTMMDIVDTARKLRYVAPALKTFWYGEATFIKWQWLYILLTVSLLVIPTTIVDFFVDHLKIKIPVRLSRLVRKIYYVQDSLKYFLQNEVSFDNSRCKALDKELPPEELTEFRQAVDIPKEKYLAYVFWNARFYLLKETDDSIPRAVRNMYFFAAAHYGLLALFWGAVLYGVILYLKTTLIYREYVN